jgi:hypothetical protein
MSTSSTAFGVLCFSVIGLFFSLVIHVAALLGLGPMFKDAPWILLWCDYFVGLALVIPMQRMCRGLDLYNLLKTVFADWPRWMFWAAPVLFYYGVLIGALIGFLAQQPGGMKRDSTEAQVLSACCISFYSASAVFAFSAWNFDRRGRRRCPTQHPVGPVTISCSQCGASIADS